MDDTSHSKKDITLTVHEKHGAHIHCILFGSTIILLLIKIAAPDLFAVFIISCKMVLVR
jgi:hypothetical protein